MIVPARRPGFEQGQKAMVMQQCLPGFEETAQGAVLRSAGLVRTSDDRTQEQGLWA
jgi:hypothetical protein